jgi:hypothetical protein
MSDEYLEPITPEVVEEPKDSTKIILVVVLIVVVLCICLCLCIFVGMPVLLGPTMGEVFSEIEYQMLTPMP